VTTEGNGRTQRGGRVEPVEAGNPPGHRDHIEDGNCKEPDLGALDAGITTVCEVTADVKLVGLAPGLLPGN
jgi:hypothetical protein